MDFGEYPALSGKIIVVTGGNSGLGYKACKAFAGKGAEVILASLSGEKGALFTYISFVSRK